MEYFSQRKMVFRRCLSTSQNSDMGMSSVIISDYRPEETSMGVSDVILRSKDTLESLLPSPFIQTSDISLSEPDRSTPPGMLLQIHPPTKPSALRKKPARIIFKTHQNPKDKKQPRDPDILINVHGPSRTEALTQDRIKWTQELHELFVECTYQLGGAKKATPKAIHRLMKHEELTIFHVKSHLQKYRMSIGIPALAQERKASMSSRPLPDSNREMLIVEAIMLQVDIQKRLSAQLQLQIEEQRKQLKMISELMKVISHQSSSIYM